MRGFMVMLLTCSISMSALALFYMAVMPFLEKRYSEKGRYYAWLIIVVGLIIPFRPQWDNAIVRVNVPAEMDAPVIRIANAPPVTVPVTDVNAGLSPALHGISLWQVAAAVWLAGVVAFLAYHAIKHYRFLKMARRWSESIADEEVLSLFQNLKSESGISRQIGLSQCLSIGSPMMIGFVSPRILLPAEYLAQDELRFILKHELVHYKRKDLYYKCLVLTATAIHWFNPIVYIMAKMIGNQCELSCDAETMHGTDTEMRRHYSETILGVAKYQSKLRTAFSTDFYGGKKGMKKRISSILDTKKKRVGIAILCGALILTLGTALVFAANTGAADDGSFRAGDTVAVQIIADSVSDMTSYEFELHYDDTMLRPQSIHASIDKMWAGCMPTTDEGLVVSGIMSYDEESGERFNTGVNGENILICEIIMEVLMDGPVDGFSFARHYVSNSEPLNSPTKSAEVTSGWNVKVVPLSEEQRLIFEGQESNLFEDKRDPETGLPEMTYSEGNFQGKILEPGYLSGGYSGKLRLNAEKTEVSPGESFQVDVSLSEPAESNLGQVIFWFDPDVLTYQGFDGDEELHPYYQVLDAESGIVEITFSPLEANDYRIERFGSFSFTVSEDAQLSGRQSSLVIVADYDNNDKSEFILSSQSGEVSVSIR